MKALTDAYIRTTRCPSSEGRFEVADSTCRGLRLRITAKGVRSFAFVYYDRASRRFERITLGRYPDLTLAEARRKANDLRSAVANGTNPAAHRRASGERTFAALAVRYLNEHARRFKRTAAKDERNLRLHILPHWQKRDVSTLKRGDVIRLLEGIVTADKPILANRVQALLSKVFNFAIEIDVLGANPCARLSKRGVERVKTRTLTDAEIKFFWDGAGEPPLPRAIGLALRLILLTACRPGEIAGMTRSELEMRGGHFVSWTIPAARTKNGRAHYVPLLPLAAGLIREAVQLTGEDREFVFPSPDNAPIKNYILSAAMRQLLSKLTDDAAAAETWRADPPTPHDLRRTAATRMAACGVSGEDISAVLNHARSDVTGRHYNHYDRAEEKGHALERLELVLGAILNPLPANVIPLTRSQTQ